MLFLKKCILLSLIIFQLVFVVVNSFCQNGAEFIYKLNNQLNANNKKFHEEKLFIHTDKIFYLLGETVWFKAYINGLADNKPSALSKKLFIQLIDEKGNQVVSNVYEIKNGIAVGDFDIPANTVEGNAVLIAYTSWMLNDRQNFFMQKIFISHSVLPDLCMKLQLNSPVLDKNKFNASLFVRDAMNISRKNTDVKYEMFHANKNIFKGFSQTGIDDKAELPVSLFNSASKDNLNLQVETKIKGNKTILNLEIPSLHDSIDFQFFPEGGDLVNNMESKVGFKILDKAGIPFNITAELLEDGQPLFRFSETYKGMGWFKFTPISGKHYSVKILEPQGISEVFHLPSIKNEGVIFKLDTLTKDTLFMSLNTSNKIEKQKFYFVVRMRDEIYHASFKKIIGESRLIVPLYEMPMGVAQVTVFDEKENPVAESLVFINKYNKLNIKIDGLNQEYQKRGLVELMLHIADEKGLPQQSNFSLSVADAVSTNDNPDENIFSKFYLSPDLKGEIITPSYYFQDTPEADRAMECLMLTHGWRRFTWNEIRKVNSINYAFYNRDGLEGIVFTAEEKLFPHAKILLTNPITKTTYLNYSDIEGKFIFPFDENICNEEILNIRAYDTINKKDLIVKIYHTNNDTSLFFEKPIFSECSIVNYASLPVANIEIYKKINFVDHVDLGSSYSKLKRNYSSYDNLLDVIKEIKPFQIFNSNGRSVIVFSGSINSLINLQGAYFVLDGIVLGDDISNANAISLFDIDDIKVYTDPVDIQRYSSFYGNGIIDIKTKKGILIEQIESKTKAIKTCFNLPRQFYAQKYDNKINIKKKDLRTTIFWNSEITTDSTGQSKISFYNCDINSHVIGILQGVSPTGQIGFAVFNYEVK